MTKCRQCDAPVIMAETASGKQVPFDMTATPGFQLSQGATGRYMADAVEIYKPHACAQSKLIRETDE